MQGGGRAFAKAGIHQLVGGIQLIKGMSALMDDAKQRGKQIILIIMRGDTHVVFVELHGKGMLCLAYRGIAAVEAHYIHQVLRQLLLPLDEAGTMQQ